MAFSDSFFKKIEKKTNVGKDTILDLAKKLQQNDLKNEGRKRSIRKSYCHGAPLHCKPVGVCLTQCPLFQLQRS